MKSVPKETFSFLAAPAQRALANADISTLKQLSKLSVAEVLTWHGMGPSSIPKLKQALQDNGLKFKDE